MGAETRSDASRPVDLSLKHLQAELAAHAEPGEDALVGVAHVVHVRGDLFRSFAWQIGPHVVVARLER